MIHTVNAPALDGRHPLGFLASLGLTRLLHTQLSFDSQTCTAIIHSQHSTVEAIVQQLEQIVAAIPDDGLLPDTPPDFPRRSTTGKDPMRATRDDYRNLAAELHHQPKALTWLASISTDLAIDNENRTALSLYMAPSGKQTVGTYLGKSLEAIRAHPEYLHQALTRWKRIAGISGEYLDHQVINNGASDPRGKSTERGVPGATWLACMALPLLRVTGTGTAPRTTGWHKPTPRGPSTMIWPLWKQPLDPTTIQTLLEHPALVPTETNAGHATITTHPDTLAELGIFHLSAAQRQPLPPRKFAGILTPRTLHLHDPNTERALRLTPSQA